MYMFPEPNPKDHRLRYVSMNTISSELFTPDAFPRCTQANFGLYSFPLENTSNEYEVKQVKDKILDKWTQNAKAWWIGKPGEDAHMMFDLHLKGKRNEEIDPRYKAHNSIFPRSYQYEQDCMETRRLQKLEEKVIRDAQHDRELKEQSPCICSREDVQEPVEELPRWQKPPELFAESQEDPCKRREEFSKVGQTYYTEACRFYYDNYPPPPPSKYIKKFVK